MRFPSPLDPLVSESKVISNAKARFGYLCDFLTTLPHSMDMQCTWSCQQSRRQETNWVMDSKVGGRAAPIRDPPPFHIPRGNFRKQTRPNLHTTTVLFFVCTCGIITLRGKFLSESLPNKEIVHHKQFLWIQGQWLFLVATELVELCVCGLHSFVSQTLPWCAGRAQLRSFTKRVSEYPCDSEVFFIGNLSAIVNAVSFSRTHVGLSGYSIPLHTYADF